MENKRKVSPLIALVPILFLIGTLFYAIVILEKDPHIPLFTSAMFAALIGVVVIKAPWQEIEDRIIDTIKLSMIAILILMVIGMIIGTWILSGVVPTLIYYGLQIIAPQIFLLVAMIICSVVALATGSSWTTAGTIGVALMGIGMNLGIPQTMCAGAIISGAYFGDKMSPLSDTTNLAPAMAGSTLFEHIRHMFYTTVPSYIIAAILYVVLGFIFVEGNADTSAINQFNADLAANFNINPLLLLIPVITIALVIMKIPAIPGLFIGALLGGVAAMIFQGADLGGVIEALHYGIDMDTGNEGINELLNRGGLDSMMWTISLILCALTFGGVMEGTGMLSALVYQIMRIAKGTGGLVTATVLTAIGINILASDQYLAIVLPGRMYKESFDRLGLHPKNLSRCLEDSGTMTSPLVPWNTCGAFMIEALGVAPFGYQIFCFMNLLNPVISIIYGFTGFSMHKVDHDPKAAN